MTKRSRKKTEQEVLNAAVKPLFHSFYLQTSNWTSAFSDRTVKIIIAEGLNYCTEKEGMRIAGYLITVKILFIVLELRHGNAEELLAAFELWLSRKLREFGKLPADDSGRPLLIRGVLRDEQLIRLLTGRQVLLPYTDKKLLRLKELVSHADFCSAIDYSGARGPVSVSGITY